MYCAIMSTSVIKSPLDQVEESQCNELSEKLFKCLHEEDIDLFDVKSIPDNLDRGKYECTGETSSIAQHGTTRKKVTKTECSEEVLPLRLYREELFEEKFWEQQRNNSKIANNSKQKALTTISGEEQKLPTYRKTNSKNKVERRLPLHYKFDKPTIRILGELINLRNLSQYHAVFATGRDSVMFCAGSTVFINAVKVYRLGNDDVKNKVILQRAQREYDRLYALRRYCRVPEALGISRNIIIMSYIGSAKEPAVPVNRLTSELDQQMYKEVVSQMRYTYEDRCGIVHGRLSPKRMLLYKGSIYFVGWAHSVLKDHPQAPKKLMRDCCFVTKLFEGRKLALKSPADLFKSITGQEASKELMAIVHHEGQRKTKHKTGHNKLR